MMVATSELGTPTVWMRVAFSVMASSLAWMATRIWTFSSCAHMNFSFWRRRSSVFWKRRIQENNYKIRLLGLVKTRAVNRQWRCYLQSKWHLLFLEWGLPLVYNPPHTASSPNHTGDPCPHLHHLNLPSRTWGPLEGLRAQGAHQPPSPLDRWLAPRLAVV